MKNVYRTMLAISALLVLCSCSMLKGASGGEAEAAGEWSGSAGTLTFLEGGKVRAALSGELGELIAEGEYQYSFLKENKPCSMEQAEELEIKLPSGEHVSFYCALEGDTLSMAAYWPTESGAVDLIKK